MRRAALALHIREYTTDLASFVDHAASLLGSCLRRRKRVPTARARFAARIPIGPEGWQGRKDKLFEGLLARLGGS